MGNSAAKSLPEIFSGGLSPCEHFMQLYDGDEALLGLLTTYVDDGLCGGEAAVVIATQEHLDALGERLVARGHDLVAARWLGNYLPLVAEAVLAQFMVTGGVDEERFLEVVGNIIRSARRAGARGIRGFGEMVALLWAQGRYQETVTVERLWNRLCREESIAVFCAYPLAGFATEDADPIRHVCAAHSRLVMG